MRVAPSSRANSWEDVADLVGAYGLTLDPWQEDVLRAALGERSGGRWAVRQVGLSTPRQNGKTMLIVARVLAGLLLFDEQTIIVSAHRQDTARETFFRLVSIIEDNPSLLERVDFIARSEMREYIRMKSGQEVRFKARGKHAGRGFSCDCLMLDEAQSLSAESWAAILPTMSARPNPQVWLLGTPPVDGDDDGEVFRRIRSACIARKEPRLAYLEWSADPSDDFDDPETWAKANPAFGTRLSKEAVATERASMSDDQFALERLGIWPESGAVSAPPAVRLDLWRDLTIPAAPGSWPLAAVGLDMDAQGRLWTAVAAHAPAPGVHVELLPEDIMSAGAEAAVRWLVQRCRRRPVVLPGDSGAAVLRPALLAKGVKVYPLNDAEWCAASAGLTQAIRDGEVTHLADPVLVEQVQSAPLETVKAGVRIGRHGESLSAPLLAGMCAHFGAVRWSPRKTHSGQAMRGGGARGA